MRTLSLLQKMNELFSYAADYHWNNFVTHEQTCRTEYCTVGLWELWFNQISYLTCKMSKKHINHLHVKYDWSLGLRHIISITIIPGMFLYREKFPSWCKRWTLAMSALCRYEEAHTVHIFRGHLCLFLSWQHAAKTKSSITHNHSISSPDTD